MISDKSSTRSYSFIFFKVFFGMNATATTVLSGFCQKNGFGPLGVKGHF